MTKISVVVPEYNELRDTLCALVARTVAAISPITDDFEIVLVDDGSINDSWEVICDLARSDGRVRGIRFARNFGQHMAITAGLDAATGEWVIVMDSDLQDRPEVIPDLYAKAQEGFDVVFVNRMHRTESLLYRFIAGCFYKVLNLLSGQQYNRLHGNFSIVSAAAVRAFRSLREPARFYGGLLRWVGFKQTSIDAVHGKRFGGRNAYSLARRARFGFSLIVGFSTRLLSISIFIGLLMAIVSLIMGTIIVLQKITDPSYPLPGWPSVMTAVLFTAGLTNIAIGLTGIYISQIFLQTKNRPLYIIQDQVDVRHDFDRASSKADRE